MSMVINSSATETPTKDDVASELANRYYVNDPGLLKIIRCVDPEKESDPEEPIKYLEVYESAIPSGIILAVGFPSHPESGMLYPIEIVQIAPEELTKVESNELRLPEGWVLLEEFPRPTPIIEPEATSG